MSWKFVYNPKASSTYEGSLMECAQRANIAGYIFYMWNGQVRNLSGESIGISYLDMF